MENFQIPEILKFTVLPYRLTARTWVDPVFRQDLLRNPRTFLLGHSTRFPRECSYVIHPDSASIQHFVVPYVSPEVLNKLGTNLLDILEAEMGDSTPFECWLPPKVMHSAIIDPAYLAQLNMRAVSFLRGEGYTAPRDICVIQNAPTTFNIPLKFNRALYQDFDAALLSIRGDNAVVSSSGCCASGTCC